MIGILILFAGISKSDRRQMEVHLSVFGLIASRLLQFFFTRSTRPESVHEAARPGDDPLL